MLQEGHYDGPLTKQLAYILYIYTEQQRGEKALDYLDIDEPRAIYALVMATESVIKAKYHTLTEDDSSQAGVPDKNTEEIDIIQNPLEYGASIINN